MFRCGSSPYIRGTRGVNSPLALAQRFIPVHTGNTYTVPWGARNNPVHPRTYGEHERGYIFKHAQSRFIPVHTGNTHQENQESSYTAVHPRTYGEHLSSFKIVHGNNGSSPYIRGTLRNVNEYFGLNRFIPVHTGNTADVSLKNSLISVHPRTYGEHDFNKLGILNTNGSSPYIRGTLDSRIQ